MLGFLILFLVPAISRAQLVTTIDLIQNSQGIVVETNMNLDAALKPPFVLFKQATILSITGFVVTRNTQGDYVLSPQVGNTAQVKYQLNVDPAAVHFFTEDMNWYPRAIATELTQRFQVRSQLQDGYQLVHSATGRTQEGISAVLGPLFKYVNPSKKLMIFLQKPDPTLAQILLDHLENDLAMYEKDFGAYPYDQFAVVESPDEIGFAFPQMTWIGSNLLRFPFILKTSLPHELLHSWWGNSVYVDYPKGNWCEGLTVFGADYALLNESEKVTYRQKALLEYVDYVKTTDEISLAQFVSRGEDRALQAIGYNKSLMMFVMLQDLVGMDQFRLALSLFNKNFQNKVASYQDLFQILIKQNTQNKILLDQFYSHWILQKGAVQLNQVTGHLKKITNHHFEITIQIPASEITKIEGVPLEVMIYFKDGHGELIKFNTTKNLRVEVKEEPTEFTVDPNFKIFRILSDQERPITFSQFFGSTSAELVSNHITESTLKQVFTNITFESKELSAVDFNQPGILLVEYNQTVPDPLLQTLKLHDVQIFEDLIKFGSEQISLDQNGFFISFKENSKIVILFKTNASLPMERWFQRWSRYGAQGFVILTPTGAAKQGVWSTSFKQKFRAH